MSQITISALQAYLAERYGDWAQEQGLFIKLVEEMGEIAELLNMRAGRKVQKDQAATDQELATELADLLHYAVAIASLLDVDLNQVMLDKDQEASQRYGHTRNLREFMAAHDEASQP